MKKIRVLYIFSIFALFITSGIFAQQTGGRPPVRKHTVIKRGVLKTLPSDQKPGLKNQSEFKKSKKELEVKANGIPIHGVGQFPNRYNPNSIKEQNYNFSLSLNQTPATEPIPLHNDTSRGPPNIPFGIAVNGVLFDPGTAEFYIGDRKADWNYEAMSGAVLLGLDHNHAHVQPNGSYHYHGLPNGLLEKIGLHPKEHSPVVGYSMDGYPIYALYGFKDPENRNSEIIKLNSSYRLKKGKRPNPPGGKYDGTFSKDYEFVRGLGDLDECNGRFTKTKEFPRGTYAYYLTENWPVIPRYFRAEPLRLRGGMHQRRENRNEIPPRKSK